jgi:hypothetical protein
MAEDWPKVKARHSRRVPPWMAIIEREVEFAPRAECEICHAVSSRITSPSSQRYRMTAFPSSGNTARRWRAFSWELPAGLIIPARIRSRAAAENGFCRPRRTRVRCYAPCTARLSNRVLADGNDGDRLASSSVDAL